MKKIEAIIAAAVLLLLCTMAGPLPAAQAALADDVKSFFQLPEEVGKLKESYDKIQQDYQATQKELEETKRTMDQYKQQQEQMAEENKRLIEQNRQLTDQLPLEKAKADRTARQWRTVLYGAAALGRS